MGTFDKAQALSKIKIAHSQVELLQFIESSIKAKSVFRIASKECHNRPVRMMNYCLINMRYLAIYAANCSSFPGCCIKLPDAVRVNRCFTIELSWQTPSSDGGFCSHLLYVDSDQTIRYSTVESETGTRISNGRWNDTAKDLVVEMENDPPGLLARKFFEHVTLKNRRNAC
jgi:hypothetical protein